MPVDNTIVKRSALVVEIVGPAGAGKTTLLRTLRQCNEKIRVGVRLHGIKYIPLFVGHALLSLPTFLRQFQTGRWFTYREMNLMVYLKVLHRVLRRQVLNKGIVTVLDQGPIYKLARLHGFTSRGIKSQSFEKWWDSALNQWNSTLDLVIQLDAPDTILMERIYTRSYQHRVQGKSEQEAYAFLARYRTSYEHILSKLIANGELKVLRFDTNQETLDQIVDKVLAAFDTEHGEC